MMRFVIGPTVALLLGAAIPLAGAAAQGSSAPGSSAQGSGPAGQNGGSAASQARHAPTTSMPRSTAVQDRELDQIGNKLLRETPKNPPQDNAATGGGLEPPH